MSRGCLICRCCGGRMNTASMTNPNICCACEQLLADDSPADAAAQMGTEGVVKEELMNGVQNLKVGSFIV